MIGVCTFATVTDTDAAVVVLPALSRAIAVSTCVPFTDVAEFQKIEYGGEGTSRPRSAPSSRNCTPATPTLSWAAALIETTPVTVAAAAGAVIDTTGAWTSGAPMYGAGARAKKTR